jgi:hypothetical protein
MGSDRQGEVRGFYSPERDDTFLTVGHAGQAIATGSPYFFGGTIWYLGAAPLHAGDSVAWGAAQTSVTLALRGRAALALQEAASTPPSSTLLADDTVVVFKEPPKVGQYHGPPEMAMVPIVFPLRYHTLVQLARATRVQVRLGDTRYVMSANERRDLRAMLRVALCTGARVQ